MASSTCLYMQQSVRSVVGLQLHDTSPGLLSNTSVHLAASIFVADAPVGDACAAAAAIALHALSLSASVADTSGKELMAAATQS